MGKRSLQTANDFQRRLPDQPAEMQVRASFVPSECLPVGHCLPVAARRGEGLASGNHNQTDSAGHPRPSQRTKHQGSSAS